MSPQVVSSPNLYFLYYNEVHLFLYSPSSLDDIYVALLSRPILIINIIIIHEMMKVIGTALFLI